MATSPAMAARMSSVLSYLVILLFIKAETVDAFSVSLSDRSGALVQGDTVAVTDGKPHTFTCTAQDTRPGDDISWFLDDVPQQSVNLVTNGNEEFVNLMSQWKIIPRGNGMQELKCRAVISGRLPSSLNASVMLNVTGRPIRPGFLTMTGRTSSSITVSWIPGYNGGADQWFIVSHKRRGHPRSEYLYDLSERVTGGVTTYEVKDLQYYTEYEIRVHAENEVGRSSDFDGIEKFTKFNAASSYRNLIIEYNTYEGIVTVHNSRVEEWNADIQIEVAQEGSDSWKKCGDFTHYDKTLDLKKECAGFTFNTVRARLCPQACSSGSREDLCSKPSAVKAVRTIKPFQFGFHIGIGVAIVVMAAAIVACMLYRWRKGINKQRGAESMAME